MNVFAAHVCFSKVSWARRLKARAATVLSRRCGDAPGAVGATPAGEFITFDPDQAFIHTSTFCVRLGFELGRGEAEHINASSAEGGLLPAEEYFLRNRRETK